MKTWCQQRARALRAMGAGLAVLTLFFAWQVWSQGNPPALIIVSTGPNEVTLVVTNPVTNQLYEIWWTQFMDADSMSLSNGSWQPVYTGVTNQTTFVMDLGDTETGFFRSLNGNDFDLDGVPNSQDAWPFDSSVGLLRVTIESPANGSNVP